MEAIVKISGKQYRVVEGARLTVDRLETRVGDEVSFGDVLLLTDGARATVGTPTVDGAAVTVRVVAATRGPKLIVYKYKAKKRFRRTQGARAEQSLLEVLTVRAPGSKAKTVKATAAAQTKATETETEPAKPAKAEKLKAEKPKAEKPKAEKPKAEKPKAEKPKAEKPKAEKPKAEKPAKAEGE